MSSSDRPRATNAGGPEGPPPRTAVVDDVTDAISTLEQLVEKDALSPEQVRAVVSAATRLYAAASVRAGHELPPVGPEVSTTDAVTLACALVRSQDLTPFEMAVWFSRGQRSE
jgi:hypothetical protein